MFDLPAVSHQGEVRRATRSAAAFADPRILSRAALDAVVKLNPARLLRNPVIFVTEVVSALVTVLAVRAALQGEAWGFLAGIAAWLWFTVLFATFAEAVAETAARVMRPRQEAEAPL